MNSSVKEVKLHIQWDEVSYVPIVGPLYVGYVTSTERYEEHHKCLLTVYVQGGNVGNPLEEWKKHELVILTVHDIGTNPPNSFVQFANCPEMAELSEKALFLHVCVPGQEPGAKNLSSNHFPPTTSYLADVLPQVLEHFGVKKCIAMGEGAGADIICRFAYYNPDMVHGIVLIHCTSTTHGIVGNLKEVFANLRIDEGKMSDSSWDYLMAHKFGKPHSAEERKQLCEGSIQAYGLNEHNLSLYLHAFANRADLSQGLELHGQSFSAILVTGAKSAHNENVFHMYGQMDKEKTGLIVAENAVDVIQDAREYLALALIAFCRRHVQQGGQMQNNKTAHCATKATAVNCVNGKMNLISDH